MTDYDSPWKDVLEQYFTAFTAFFFPPVHEGIDWEFDVFVGKKF